MAAPPTQGGMRMPAIVQPLTLVFHVGALALSLSIAAVYREPTLFSWHPVLMSLGYLFFMAESVMSSIMFRHLAGEARVAAIWKHLLWNMPCQLCILGGFYAIYQNKVNNGYNHFVSTHAKVGLATMVLGMMAPIGGAVSFRKLGLLPLLPAAMQPVVKTAHRYLGLFVFLLSLVATELALSKHWMARGLFTPIWQWGVGALGLLVLVIGWVAQPESSKQKKQ